MSVSFCLPHPVAVSAFMMYRGLCACTEMLWMCVLYVSFGSKVRCAWVQLLFCCLMLWMCLVCVVVLCWIDHVWSSKECVCCACDPNERLSAPSICFVCVFVCRKLSPHLGV